MRTDDDNGRKQRLWTFNDDFSVETLENIFTGSGINFQRQSLTLSYTQDTKNDYKVYSHGSLVTYGSGELELNGLSYSRSYWKQCYQLEATSWTPLGSKESISEEEFYRTTIYAKPLDVVNLQLLQFRLSKLDCTVEVDLERKLMLLVCRGEEVLDPPLLLTPFLKSELTIDCYSKPLFSKQVSS